MIPTTSEGRDHSGCCNREQCDGGFLQSLAQVVIRKRVALIVASVLAVAAVVVIVLVADGNKHQQQYAPVHGKVCGSVEVTGNASLLANYTSCVTIEGNLRIQLIEYNNKNNPLLGLPNLVQVTGYVIIYRLSYLQTLSHLLPRLAVIRGQELFHGYSLVILGNIILQEVNLWNLTHVLAGAVRVEKNLCRGPPHRWDLLSASPSLNIIQDYGVCIYPMCEEQRNCTNITSVLNTQCTSYGGCYQGSQCHPECAGGCYAPHDPEACVACRNYLDGNICVPDCSASVTNKVHHLGYRCIREDQCAEEPWTWKAEKGIDGSERLFCIRCNDNCYGTCHGARVSTPNLGRQLRNCRWLDGNLEIMVSGGRNLMQQLEDNLGQLELVTGYLKVYGSDTLFSLNFLKSLRVIGGNELVHGRYALYVLDNEKLQELFDWNNNTRSFNITKGKLFFQHNPSLCQELIYEIAIKGGKDPNKDVHVSPAEDTEPEDTGPCYKKNLEVRVSALAARKLKVSWSYHFYGNDDRFVIGYYLYYREAPEEVRLYQGRDACNDNVVWEREFREYKRNKSYEVELDKLKPYTKYAVYVDVYYTDSVKNASRSSIIYVTTMVSDPSPVRNLKVEQQKNSSNLTVTWLRPEVANGPLNIYEVKYVRLKFTTSDSHSLNRDDICEDRKYEELLSTATEPSYIAPTGGKEDDAEAGCCNCSNSIARVSMEERAFDRQLDINFENYIWQSVFCKMYCNLLLAHICMEVNFDHSKMLVIIISTYFLIMDFTKLLFALKRVDDEGESATPFIASTSRESLTTAATTSFGPMIVPGSQKRHSRRRRLRSVNDTPTLQNRHTHKNMDDVLEVKEECKTVREITPQGASEECDEKVLQTNKTRITLTGLRHITTYRVWVRSCHYEGRNCSAWSLLEATTTANMSIYKIKNFKVQEVKLNEMKYAPAELTPNNSNSRLTMAPSSTVTPSSTFIISWEPPVLKDDSLAYIIRYEREGEQEIRECKLEEEVRRNKFMFSLQDMNPGNYFFEIKLRTRNGDGPPTTLNVKFVEDRIYWIVFIPFLCGGIFAICIIEAALWLKRRRTAAEPELSYGWGLLQESLKKMEGSVINSDALQVDQEHSLGKGCFGTVYRGKLTLATGEEQLVAVKTNENETYENMKLFLKEAVLMQSIESNFVVRLIGLVKNYPPIYVVMELMERGDLKTFLIKDAGETLTMKKMVEMAVEAADGMAYLGAKKLVHRDLAARNCMLDKGLTLKIGDFGLTRYLTTDYYKTERGGILPVRWMAPESVMFSRYSAKSDVWSYGVLLWELSTGGLQPYQGYGNTQVCHFIKSGILLDDPKRGPKIFQQIMKECWAAIPNERPTFKRIVQLLLPWTSERYPEYFQGVSFFHSSSSCALKSLDDMEAEVHSKMTRRENADAENSRISSSMPPYNYREDDPNLNKEDFESQSNEDDDLYTRERSSCAPLSCITGQVDCLNPTNDATNKTLLFRTF